MHEPRRPLSLSPTCSRRTSSTARACSTSASGATSRRTSPGTTRSDGGRCPAGPSPRDASPPPPRRRPGRRTRERGECPRAASLDGALGGGVRRRSPRRYRPGPGGCMGQQCRLGAGSRGRIAITVAGTGTFPGHPMGIGPLSAGQWYPDSDVARTFQGRFQKSGRGVPWTPAPRPPRRRPHEPRGRLLLRSWSCSLESRPIVRTRTSPSTPVSEPRRPLMTQEISDGWSAFPLADPDTGRAAGNSNG